MSDEKEQYYDDCSFVSIHYIICECGETFPSEHGLRTHLDKEHPHKRERKEFKCGVCGSIFGQEEDCIAHYEEQHLESDQEVKQEYSSDEETKHDPPNDQEIQEQIQIHYVGTNEECEIQAEESELTHDEEEYQEMSVEEMTQEETTQPTGVLVNDEESKEYPKPQPPSIKMVRDPDTGQLVLVFNRPKKMNPRKTPAKKKKAAVKLHIVCEVCGRKYASNAALKYHQRIHSGEKPYKCTMCPKAFTMPLFLQIHFRTHTGERPFACTECPKAFTNKAALLRHERVHTGEKPYSCPMCYKSFTQSNSMKLHVATVHLKQPAPYKSKKRRLKENNRQTKKDSNQTKIKAFAPRTAGEEVYTDENEVVISEEIQQDQEMYEIVYEDVEYQED